MLKYFLGAVLHERRVSGVITNGNWGACQWTISENGTLTIYEGKAEGISTEGMSPWYDHSGSIRSVLFSGKVSLEKGSSLSCMFKDCLELKSIDLTNFDTEGVTSMTSMFEGCTQLEEIDLSCLDLSSVTSFSGMFNSCESLRKVDLTGVDTGNLISMIGMFMNCKSLENIDRSSLDTGRVVDMSWLFCGCEKLKKADLSYLDTSNVVDMSCMFLSCASLEKVSMEDMDISSVMDTSRMFMYCSDLRCLDVSGTDNSGIQQSEDMFLGCDRLCSLAAGENFSLLGGGNASMELPESRRNEDTDLESDWRKSPEGIYYKPGTKYYVDYTDSRTLEEMPQASAIAAEEYTIALPEFKTPEGMVFKEWNTRKDGKGKGFSPGQRIRVYKDMSLYAIWAGSPVVIREYEIPELVHGQTATWASPQVDPSGADLTEFKAQIRRPGSEEWTELAEGERLVTEDDGAMLRYRAANFVGATYTEPVRLSVAKAVYDMSDVHWVLPEDLSYDGQEKEVHLEGLPEGVRAAYTGNTGVDVGDYMATAVLDCDEVHYEKPDLIEPLLWSIGRGHYNMEGLGWSYMEAFVYDGTEKKVRLNGLPEGTTPYYDGADGVDAGVYTATCGLEYDLDRYDRPEPIAPCRWEIKKTTHDMSGVRWGQEDTFIYDGGEKKVELTGLPVGVTAQYSGNHATDAGQYTARAAFIVDDPKNYCIPDPVSFNWEIKKADHDLSRMEWTQDSFVYDGEDKEIHLEGIPEGIEVSYEGTTGRLAGAYLARAEFFVEDLKNYNPIDSWTRPWQIKKASYDMSRVRWNYSSYYVYNGQEKSVALKGLPEGIIPTYEGEKATEAGDYIATASLVYDEINYEEPTVEDCSWKIIKATPSVEGISWQDDRTFTYNGEPQGVYLTTVPEDFTVEYEGNSQVDAGNYVAFAHLRPVDDRNFRDPEPLRCDWKIARAKFELPEIRWDSKGIRTYDGEEKSVRIMDLPAGVRAVYTGNMATDAGDYTARAEFEVEDTRNFIAPDPVETSWNIDRSLIDISGVRWNTVTDFTYDGSEKRVALTGVPEGVEVRYEQASATDAGEYSARAELIPPEGSNYRTTRILSQLWRIRKAVVDLGNASWEDPGKLIYDGREKIVRIKGLPDGLRAMYEGERHTKAGEYTASAKLIPYDVKNYTAPSIEPFTWRIEKADISVDDAVWTDSTDFKYDGQPKTVVIENLSEHLKAIYEDNEDYVAGQYVATASFESLDERNYNAPAPIQHSWTIAKGDIDISEMKWAEERQFPYDGQEKSLVLENVPEELNVIYKGNVGTDADEYIASAQLEPVDPKNYNVPTVDPCNWQITKADLDISNVSWVSAEKLVYDGNLKVVGLTGLPDDVNVEYENNTAIEAGTYHASAVLSTDSKNYQAPPIRGCTWTIAKADVDMSEVRWNYVIDFTYDGYEKSVELMDLPPGVKAVYSGNEAIEAGTYTAEATILLEDNNNYEIPVIEPLEWRILKSDYDMSSVRWEGTEGQVYDGIAKEVVLSGLDEGLEPIYEGNIEVDAGTYEASVRFLYDEDNYNPPEDMHTTWTIEKAPLDLSQVRWDYDGPFKASRKIRTVELMREGGNSGGGLFKRKSDGDYIGLPQGTKVRYEGNTGKAPGLYEARAYLDIPVQPNHEVKGPLILNWEITNA